MKQRLLDILFWSVIAAAFVGPGTVTTAAAAGAGYGHTLLWALTFSIAACIVLQEASARLTLASGRNLGEALREHFAATRGGRLVTGSIAGSILLGCAAYEAGNILGAVAGVGLVLDVPPSLVTLSCGAAAAALLWFGSTALVARVLGLVVAFMGVCFITTAVLVRPPVVELLAGAVVPRLPGGAELLVLGLIGTTIVPYNVFLGSSLAARQSLPAMRFGLAAAIVIGGVISVSILIVGAALAEPFTFAALAAELEQRLGGWAAHLLGLGLWAAGFTSAVTAPLAAALVTRSLLGRRGRPATPGGDVRRYRAVWGSVLAIGVGFGLTGVQPVPAIIAAQALNGVILPLVAVYLLIMVNDPRLLGPGAINGPIGNVLGAVVVLTTLVLGLGNVMRAAGTALGVPAADPQLILALSIALALAIAWPVARRARALRREAADSQPS
jgi:manganese transport protein